METIFTKQKINMNFIIGKTIKKFLKIGLILSFFLLYSEFNYATTDWSSGTHLSVKNLLKEGVVEIRICYFDSHGATDGAGTPCGDGHAGLSPGDGYLTLTMGNEKVYITTNENGANPTHTTQSGNSNNWSAVGLEQSGTKKWLTIHWKPYTSGPYNISFNGQWWRRGACVGSGEQTINYSINNSFSYSISDLNITGLSYTTNNNKPAVKISWSKSRTDGNADGFGKLYLREQGSSENLAEINAVDNFSNTLQDGEFILDASPGKRVNLNKTTEYIVAQEYVPTSNNNLLYKGESAPAKLPAFPQVKPGSLKAELDPATLKINISWEIDGGVISEFIDNKPFILQYGTFTENTPYELNKNKYNYSFDVNPNEEKTFAISVTRDNNQAWNLYKQSISFAYSSKHKQAKNLKVILLNNDTAKITWDIEGVNWATGSKAILTRLNLTSNSIEDIQLTKASFEKGHYYDTFIQICRRYKYKLTIISPDVYGDIEPIYTPEEITPYEIGSISNLQVSKGYFSDRTELSWKSQGRFDNFRVRRVEYGKQNADTVLVATVNDSGAEITLTEDTKGSSGVYYTYIVEGVVLCDGERKYSNELKSIGFRSQTGSVYGRITYQNGQAVPNVDVLLESDLPNSGKSVVFNGTDAFAEIDKNIALNDSSITLQAWIAPSDASPTGTILAKEGEYELSLNNGNFQFNVGASQIETPYTQPTGVTYTHVTAVKRNNTLSLYLNGKLVKFEAASPGKITTTNSTFIGKNSTGNHFKGNIDEVRVWNVALDSAAILRDYSRLLYGGESGLKAYWRFNEGVVGEFYDISYEGNEYHANHGTLTHAVYSAVIPSSEQLTLKGVTNTSGNYTISGIPFAGQGTMYRVIPRLGTHQFDPVEQQRLISTGSLTHTCDFTDKSSFEVSGYVYYTGGTVPVRDASFEIDGLVAAANNRPVLTDVDGKFLISVPVGVHDVRVVKNQHVFENEGKITNSDGSNRNYQAKIENIHLFDDTRVKFIGRVAGGAVQEAYPLGHSLSKNNLSNQITITMVLAGGQNKEITTTNKTESFFHKKVRNLDTNPKTSVTYSQTDIKITPDVFTGEFEAMIIPENFNVTSVNVVGYDNILEGGKSVNVDLTNALNEKTVTYEFTDTLVKPNVVYKDTVAYNYSQQFIKRLTPTIAIKQLDQSGNEMNYFGEKEIILPGKVAKIPVYDIINSTYTFDKPVFAQNMKYKLRGSVFENFKYFENGVEVPSKEDHVPTSDGTFFLYNALQDGSLDADELPIDSVGVAEYEFTAGKPEVTAPNATKSLGVSLKIGDVVIQSEPITAIILGFVPTGNNFVTAGPDRVNNVLRDPPGSGSYSYLEKGTTIEKTEAITGGITLTENINQKTVMGLKQTLINGLGVAVSVTTDVTTEEQFGLKFSQSYSGEGGWTTNTEYTTRWETSSDPLYVGPKGDVYIGNSTNIITGVVNMLNVIETDSIDAPVETVFESADGKYSLIKYDAIGLGVEFPTVFAYPQRHIEENLIPNLKKIRSQKLKLSTVSDETAQAEANTTHEIVYRSNLPHNDKNFGLPNTDVKAFGTDASPSEKYYTGKSYTIFYPTTDKNGKIFENYQDTILTMTQSIRNWEKIIADNERIKLLAQLDENISFHAGSKIEKSKTFSSKSYENNSFEFVTGASKDLEFNALFGGIGAKVGVKLESEGKIGGKFEDSKETKSTFGFVLEDTGYDYLSVDVKKYDHKKIYEDMLRNKEIDFLKYVELISTTSDRDEEYVFITRAGATSCPYEGEYIAKYYEPEKNHIINQATARVEVPVIGAVDGKNMISNVPSARKAVFKIYLQNNSESNTDRYYDLYINEDSNPDGASFFIDGAPLGAGRAIFVPAGATVVKTLEVGKGTAMSYENLQLVLCSQCEWDVFSEVSISAFFVPSCSDVKISLPNDKWTLNAETPNITADGRYYLPIKITDFDVNYSNFDHIAIQYKPSAASDADWVTLVKYYADDTKYDAAQGAKAKITSGTIDYQFIIGNLPDQNYDIAAVSVCSLATGNVETVSNIITGIKDTYRPRLFGAPQPANGILGISDEIRLNFNEAIAAGELSDNLFEVTGTRKGEIISHAASVKFDGQTDYLETEALRNLTDKSFTVEMGIQRDNPTQNGTIFSHGNVNNSFEFGVTTDKRLKVKVGETTLTTDNPVDMKEGEWEHIAVVYENSAEPRVKAYYNLVQVIDRAVSPYAGVGVYNIGRSITSNEHFNGKISELRIWDDAQTLASLNKNKNVSLQGSEIRLSSYYPMNEGRGEVVIDKARGANAAMNARWFINRDGYAAEFTGNSYLRLSTGALPIPKDMDHTIEFWFKAEPGQTNAALVSNGRGDNNEEGGSSDKLNIGFDAAGKLAVSSNGFTKQAEGDFLDNSWHHFALAVNRNNGRSSIFIDGKLNSYFDSGNLNKVQAASLLLGARPWYAKGDAATEIIDNHFKGKIDEFRMWNTYKNETMVYEENNISLKGSEMGLLSYYPFETYIDWQGTKEMQFTLADKALRGVNAPIIPDAVNKGAIANKTDVAPVKERGPQTPISINFVVNNDALIITPAAANGWNDFEQTIVTFKVRDVKDLNGNKLVSPVSWTAYIDRNQLNWSETELNLNKMVYEPYEFTLNIVNNGGSDQTYSIENVPAWLKVTPNKGTIGPKSNVQVTFVVNEGLNSGYYSEQLYLLNGDGVARTLTLNLQVKGETPTWTVNPADYKYSMSVFGKLKVNNIYSTSKDDILAAFKDGKCIGVTKNVYDENMDLWYSFLTIYGNEKQGSTIEFRIWDSNTGKIFGATPDRTISFVNDAIFGSPNEPVVFSGKEIVFQNIILNSGWNWISFNTQNSNMTSVNTVLSNGEWTGNDIVKTLNFFDSYSNDSKSWVGTLSTNGGFNNTNMFMLHAMQSQVLSVSGSVVNPQSVSIPIKGGYWNYISYLPNVNYSVKEALTDYDAVIGDVVKSQNKFAMFSGKEWVGDLKFMEPNKGYMLQRTGASDVEFSYPSIRGTLNKMPSLITGVQSLDYLNRNYSETMNIIAVGEDIQANDKILTYINGELRGVSNMIQSEIGELSFINVAGTSSDGNISFALERDDSEIARTGSILKFNANSVIGTLEKPYVLKFDNNPNLVSVYPSLFNQKLFIDLANIQIGDKIQVEMVEVATGRMVYRQIPIATKSNHYSLTISSQENNLVSGVYLIQVKINEEVKNYKVVKK